MQEFELGQKVKVKKYYRRNGRKPRQYSINKDRYNLRDIEKIGVWCGLRRIYVKGFTEHDSWDEGTNYLFSPIKTENVHIVAISKNQIVYVPDEYIVNT